MKKILLLIFLFAVSNAKTQTIPSNRIADWSVAGYRGTIPTPTLIHDVMAFGATGNGVTDDASAIRAAIDSLHGARGVIYFPAGTYLIASTIDLPDSVIIRGASADSTHLQFNFNSTPGNGFNILGSTGPAFTSVKAGYVRGSNYITVADSSLFDSTGYAEIIQTNGAWDTQPAVWADNSVGQILRITSISGDTLFFEAPLRINYDSSLNVRARKITPATEVGIECLEIARTDTHSVGLSINIFFNYAANCWVHGIESSMSIGSHVEADASTNISFKGCYIHHSLLYDGSSTHGYGLTLFAHTGQCLIENNIMEHLRHSFSLQTGANGNVIAYNYSLDPNRSEIPSNLGADISFHGHFPYSNLIEGNVVQNIQIDQTWGPSGPFNTFFRNRAELYGIVMSSGTVQSDSLNFVGNEVSNAAIPFGNYILTGTAHFEYGNNLKGTISPAGTTSLPDSSYFLSSRPSYWNSSVFPSVGIPNAISSGSNPARDRFLQAVARSVCNDDIITSENDIDEKSIAIFPNPSEGKISIALDAFTGPATITVFDLNGKIIYTEKLKTSNPIHSFELNTLSGLYFIVVNNDKITLRQKLIIIK